MKFEAVRISAWSQNIATPVRLALEAGFGLCVVFAISTIKEINRFEREHTRCSIAVTSDKIQTGKTCTCCQRWRPSSEFHRNASKADLLESHCKSCVSKRKERTRVARQRLRRRCDEFDSVIVGGPSTEALEGFAAIFGAAVKDVINET